MKELIRKVLKEELEDREQKSFNRFMDFFMKDYNIWQGTSDSGPTLYFVKNNIDFLENMYNHDFSVNIPYKNLSVNDKTLKSISNYLPIGYENIIKYMRHWIKNNLGIRTDSAKFDIGFSRPLYRKDLHNVTDFYMG